MNTSTFFTSFARISFGWPAWAISPYGYDVELASTLLADESKMYPDDDNGAVLLSMAKSGVDLTKTRQIDFSTVAPDQLSAGAFAREAAMLGFEIQVVAPDAQALADGDRDWDVICSRAIVPTYEAVTRCGNLLDELANKFDCDYDGWGFDQ
jgi:hypothetical protein